MAEWQTHRTQNAAGNRVGSSPTAATQAPGDDPGSFFFAAQGILQATWFVVYLCIWRKGESVSKPVSLLFKTGRFHNDFHCYFVSNHVSRLPTKLPVFRP